VTQVDEATARNPQPMSTTLPGCSSLRANHATENSSSATTIAPNSVIVCKEAGKSASLRCSICPTGHSHTASRTLTSTMSKR